MKTLIALLVASVVLSFSFSARADEMSWEIKNRAKGMECKLVGGMTLKRGLDFVETKHVVCKGPNGEQITLGTAACGPEGSVTRFNGRKVKVTCEMATYASK